MEKVRVRLLKKINDSYDIVIGKDIFPQIVKSISDFCFGKVAVITDSNVKGLYGNKLLSMLKKKGVPGQALGQKITIIK